MPTTTNTTTSSTQRSPSSVNWAGVFPAISTQFHADGSINFAENQRMLEQLIAERIRSLGHPAPGSYAQFGAILLAAATDANTPMVQGRPVTITLTLTKFHALTEKTRYTVGGVHSMHFLMTVRDVETRAILQGPRLIVADVHGAGGARAMATTAIAEED